MPAPKPRLLRALPLPLPLLLRSPPFRRLFLDDDAAATAATAATTGGAMSWSRKSQVGGSPAGRR